MLSSNCTIIFRSLHLDFLCADLAAPITSYSLISNLRCAPRTIHPGNCSPASYPVGFNRPIISQSLLLEFSCVNSTTPIAQAHLFSNKLSALSTLKTVERAAPPLNTPLALSPARFNHLITFKSLLLELSRANPSTPSLWTVRF